MTDTKAKTLSEDLRKAFYEDLCNIVKSDAAKPYLNQFVVDGKIKSIDFMIICHIPDRELFDMLNSSFKKYGIKDVFISNLKHALARGLSDEQAAFVRKYLNVIT